MTAIKICGITRLEDAEAAVALGANALGFVLWPQSPRHTSLETVQRIGAFLPPFVIKVGVFVNPSAERRQPGGGERDPAGADSRRPSRRGRAGGRRCR